MQQPEPENASSQPSQVAEDPPPEQAAAASPQPGTAPVVQEEETFTLYDRGSGQLLTVDTQQLVRGMLAAEMPPNFHPEALKAQAVAGHTYASYLRRLKQSAQEEGPDLECDVANWQSYTTQEAFYQRYGSLADAYWDQICQAADQVSAYLLTYEGQPILAAYCSMSNGWTEDAANVWSAGLPYLKPVESFGDTLAPDYETRAQFTPEELSQALQTAWPQIQLAEDPAGWIEVAAQSDSGYVTQVRVGDLEVHGKELRTALGLRSSDFTVSYGDDGLFTFTVQGYGHGVGFSQYGADYMARQGATFDEILSHYYPGSTLAMVAG